MKKVQWDLKEKFVFPMSAGMPTGADTVKVTPRFTINRTDDAVRLTGIYHIAANIKLDEEKSRAEPVESVILIDDVEVNEEMGYFEYAVPFNIDLSSEANDPLNVTTANPTCKVDKQGFFAVAWDVECSYQEKTVIKEEVSAEDNEEKVVIKEEISDEDNKEKVVIKEEVSAGNKKEKIVAKEKVTIQDEKKGIEAVKVIEIVEEVVGATEVVSSTAVALLESTSFNDMDEVLSFIEGLDDGISATLFRSNDVLVQSKT